MTDVYEHCNYCNVGIKYQRSWTKHLTSKRHLKNVEKQNTNIPNNTINIPLEQPNNTIYGYCKHCEKGYKHQSGLSRHEKKCKEKKQTRISEEDLEILLLKKEIELLKKENETLRNENKELKVVNNITNNNNNTIIVNAAGSENLKGIMNQTFFEQVAIACNGDDYNDIEANPDKAIELVLDEVYNKKENQNIKYPNLRASDCQIFKNNKWVTTDIDECIIDRIKECPEKLESMLEEFMNETGIIQQLDINIITNKLENRVSNNDILKLKKVFKNIIRKQRRVCYDSTKKLT